MKTLKTLKMTDVYVRQIGGDGQISQDAFNDDAFYFAELDRLLDELFENAHNRDLTWNDLARLSGLNAKTVENLGERWTKRPQFRTVTRIAAALDYKIHLDAIVGRARPSLSIASIA